MADAAHPGFKAVVSRIAAGGKYSKATAAKIAASAARKASPAAKRKNPRLLKVGGAKPPAVSNTNGYGGSTSAGNGTTHIHVHLHGK